MISVVIPNLHSPIIDRVIGALQQQTIAPHEIIVVGQDRYQRIPSTVRSIPTNRPVPAAQARNLGAQAARGTYLLFIDSDCIAAPDLIEQTIAAHRHTNQPAAISGSVDFPEEPYWAWCDNLLVFADLSHASPSGPRTYLPSLNLSLPRQLFLDHGGFDQRFGGAAGEDFEFSLRLRQAGIPLLFWPQARITHLHQRGSAASVWQHLRSFGRVHRRALLAEVDERGRSHQLKRWHAPLIVAAALPLAALDLCTGIMRQQQIRRSPAAWAGIIWAKSGWYWGLAESLLIER
jgi:GT2 family glycosyltransferase